MLEQVHAFCREWRLRLNLTKCNVIVFGEKPEARIIRQSVPDQCRWKLGNGFIKETTKYKYLGIWLTYDLKWDVHRAYVRRKALCRMNEARKLGVRRGGAPPGACHTRMEHIWYTHDAARYRDLG